MAYVKNIWVDQEVERPKTYEVTNNQDGSITLTDSFGLVTELGTPVNEVNMNHIEDGIDGCAIRKHNLTETFNFGEWVLGGTGDDEGIYKSLVSNNVGNAISDDTKWEKVEMGGGARNIGEIVTSTIPLTDAGLHLLDGALLQYGSYQAFIDYIASLYNVAEYPYVQPTNPSGITSTSGWVDVSNAFDNNASTYATISNTTGYIEWDFGQTLGVTGISINGSWVSSTAHNTNFGIYSVNSNNEETLIAHTSGASQTASYITSATFAKVNCNKIRIYADDYYPGAPARVIQINITATSTRPQYFASEAEWQQSVTDYGVCGKFVYDSTNNTVRLPKITGILEGTTDVTALGSLVEAGLPDLALYSPNSATRYGAQPNFIYDTGAVSGNSNSIIRTDPSEAALYIKDSNNIVGNSSTVQPQTIKAFYYIVIATSTKTDIEVDIDEIATDLNGKADVDLSNVPTSKAILKESYQNGTSWYRVYSDGWCEQGGRVSVPSGTSYTISFLKEYANDCDVLCQNTTSSTNTTICTCKVSSRTISGFKLILSSSSGFDFSWYAYGYLA